MSEPITSFSFRLKRSFVRVVAWGVLCFERLWPLAQPFLLVAAVFMAFAWFGLFAALGRIPHFIIVAIFFALAVFSLIPLKCFCFPRRRDINRRIEKASGLSFSALEIQEDRLPPEGDDPVAQKIWHEHQVRMAQELGHLRTGLPAPDMPRHDPYALRFIVWLLLAVSAFVGFSTSGGQLRDAFDFSAPVDSSLMRVDAWVTPPVYTHEAPIYLNNRDSADEVVVTVPQGSIATLHIANGNGVKVKAVQVDGGSKTLAAEKQDNSDSTYTLQLDKDVALVFSVRGKRKIWNFTVTPDMPPHIALVDEPGRILNGSIELKYKIDDDYGAVKGWAEITAPKKNHGHALYDAPEIILQLPTGGKGEARTVQELASHPWAGSEVTLTLFAEDGAGHVTHSEARTITLPQKIFGNPLARAVAEQRRIFVQNVFQRDRVLDMLSALLVRPDDTIQNATHVIALRSVWTRLSYAVNDDMFRNVADYMWQVAAGVEGSGIDQARMRLKQAQAALRDALRNGASPEEIERLMKKLRSVMDDYMAALAQAGDESEIEKALSQKAEVLGEDELAQKLKQLEDLAKTGDRAAAEQLLSELEQMMDNLQIKPGGSGMAGGKGQDGMRKTLDELSDLMRRQQDMLDKTYRLQKEMERSDEVPDQYHDQMDELQQEQQELQSQLHELQEDLKAQGIKPDGSLKDAERKMGEAGKGLRDGNGDKAMRDQTEALDSLRNGAQKLMQAIQEAMKQGEGKEQSKDPLGRTIGEPGKTGALPNETDIQRARRILDEIRKKLGEALTPEFDKQYLERLLKFD